MAKYQTKPEVVEAVTFEEFIEYGKANSDHIVNGIPYTIHYNGEHVSYYDNECYLINTINGTEGFTPEHMLITNAIGEMYLDTKEKFLKNHTII